LVKALESRETPDRPDGPYPAVYSRMARSLGEIGPPAVGSILNSLGKRKLASVGWARLAFSRMAGRAKDAVPTLIATLEGKDVEVRICAAMVIGAIGPAAQKACPALLVALEDPDLRVRRCAANSLGRIGARPETVVPALVRAIAANAEESGVPVVAVEVLAKMGPGARKAVPVLIKLLQSKDARVAATAALALGKVASGHDVAARAALILVLHRRKAAGGPPRSRRNDKRLVVARASVHALARLRPVADLVVNELIRAARHDRLAMDATIGLLRMGPVAKAAIPLIEDATRDPFISDFAWPLYGWVYKLKNRQALQVGGEPGG